MKNQMKKVTPSWKLLSLGFIVLIMNSATGCDSELYDDQIFPFPADREQCFSEETWRCKEEMSTGTTLELCRNGVWNPWYNCGWNGGTCEASGETADGSGEFEIGACVDPPQQQIVCETDINAIFDTNDPDPPDTSTTTDTDTDTGTESDTDTGPWEAYIPQVCSICLNSPTVPLDFYHDGDDTASGDTLDTDSDDLIHPMMLGGASDGVLGCCSVSDGNAYWGEDVVVMQSCAKGCCAFIDYTSDLKDPAPIRHGCCE